MPTCIINGTLAPYSGVWDARKIKHLYNRIGNGASTDDIADALTKTPSLLVEELIETAMTIPPPDENTFSKAFITEYKNIIPNSEERFFELRYDFIAGLINHSVRYKLMLFWHGHFVVEIPEIRYVNYLFLYYHQLHKYAFGNFKTFVEKIGLTSSNVNLFEWTR